MELAKAKETHNPDSRSSLALAATTKTLAKCHKFHTLANGITISQTDIKLRRNVWWKRVGNLQLATLCTGQIIYAIEPIVTVNHDLQVPLGSSCH